MKSPAAGLPTYFTPEEVADSLKVTRRTVYNWLHSGALKGVKAGVSWRVAQSQIDAFLLLRSDLARSRPSRGKAKDAPAPPDPSQTTIYDMGAGEAGPPSGPLKPMQPQSRKKRRR